MSETLKAMIVDDNIDNCELLADILEEADYAISVYHSGQDCLDNVPNESPDVILLDVNMPELDGYEVCRMLKSNAATALVPVVFVSALVSPEERLTGYEAGAEEYITKPFKDDTILETVQRVLELRKKSLSIEKQSREAMNTAFQAMTNSAELGQIIRFLQASFKHKTEHEVANDLLDSTLVFGLNCCVNIRSHCNGNTYFGCDKGSIEARVFERFHKGDRILDFGARTLVNSPNISLLVKNMPLDRPEDYGRIKDHLVILVDGAESRVCALEREMALEAEQQGGLRSILSGSHNELSEIKALIELQEIETQKVVSRLSDRVEKIIFGLGLEEHQESLIMDSLDEGITEINGLTQYTQKVQSSFNHFVDQLQFYIKD